ncbi:hypothetical protein PoB_003806800 [Plakobranchus ocellatus]|uniref:Uncharacterized protein n=1 Tax=Plakobranchus ocellatus TaxID=259542 RepID=A0AAV4AYJ4_9GAST|nr:hypothetical protein PoB_003806800 [Plakobranchus ocellatus]
MWNERDDIYLETLKRQLSHETATAFLPLYCGSAHPSLTDLTVHNKGISGFQALRQGVDDIGGEARTATEGSQQISGPLCHRQTFAGNLGSQCIKMSDVEDEVLRSSSLLEMCNNCLCLL